MLWIKDALEAVGREINFLWNTMGTNCLKETNNFNILTWGMNPTSSEF